MVNNYFAGYTFTTPPASDPFGNLGRNAFRAPGFWQLDTGVNKTFAIRESIRLQFRSEFFNLLNKTNSAADRDHDQFGIRHDPHHLSRRGRSSSRSS